MCEMKNDNYYGVNIKEELKKIYDEISYGKEAAWRLIESHLDLGEE